MDTEHSATAAQDPPAGSRWLVTVTRLPTEDPAARMRMLRTLESLGTAVLREGVYVLPDTADNRRALERLARYVAQNAGVASVLRVEASDDAQQEQLKRLFDRSARYDSLTKTIESLRVGFGVSDASALALDGLGERVVARRAVEQALELLILRGARRLDAQHAGDAGVLRDVTCQALQRVAVLRGVGQHVHAHARRRILRGQLGDRGQPAAAGGRILRRRRAGFVVHDARRLLHSAAALI
jgi:hypothetical protein